MFSISSYNCCCVRFWVPCCPHQQLPVGSVWHWGVPTLKARCSRKCAVPLVSSVSARLPASIHTPTVDVWAHGECSVAICAHSGQLQASCLVEVPAYRESIAECRRLGLCAVGYGRGQAAGQGRGSRCLDGIDGGAGAHRLPQVECEPPGSHCVCSLCRGIWEMER